MSNYSDNLGLILPFEREMFDINTWNQNMRVLDEAYAYLTDESGVTRGINALSVRYDPTVSELDATNVQAAIDELSRGAAGGYMYVDVTEDIEISVPTEGHLYVVLAFGSTMYTVTFTTEQGKTIVYEQGTPNFSVDNVYELSFLNLNCRWFKRMQQ